MDSSPPGSSAHGIFQAKILSRVPLPSPGDSIQGSNPRLLHLQHWQADSFTTSDTWEALQIKIRVLFSKNAKVVRKAKPISVYSYHRRTQTEVYLISSTIVFRCSVGLWTDILLWS